MDYDFGCIGADDDTLTQNEQDLILMNLTDELLMENITEQIQRPHTIFYEKTNFIDIFEERYKYICERFKDTPDLIQSVKEARTQFYQKIYKMISTKFEFTLDDFEENLNMYLITSVLYEFLILNYTENVKTFVINYINANKKSLSKNYTKIKNLDTTSLKKTLRNENDIIMIANIYDIVENIINIDFSISDICKIIIETDMHEYNNYFINKYFVEEQLLVSDSFKDNFLSILNKNNDKYYKIISDIQLELLQNATKK